MKTKIDAKSVFSIFVVISMLLIPVEMSFAMSINDVESDVSDRYAIINWKTDRAGDSEVAYGPDGGSLARAYSSQLTDNHSVMLSPLSDGATYVYNVSSENGTDRAISTTQTFTTLMSDTVPPFIGFEIPEYTRYTTIPMKVNTEPDAEVYVYVNNVLRGYDNSSISTGVANFIAIRLQASSEKTTPNEIKFVAIDPAGNRNEVVKTIYLDTAPPAITFDNPIPSAIKTTSLTISGNSDEPATMKIYIDNKYVQTVDIASPWTTTIEFPGDKAYAFEIVATDRAGNEFRYPHPILVDTIGLNWNYEDESLYQGHNLGDLGPTTYITEQTVRGRLNKKDATVVILQNDNEGRKLNEIKSDFDNAVSTGDVSRFPTTLYELLGINKDTGTITTARGTTNQPVVYVVKTDSEGYFSQDIVLTREYRLTSEEAQSLGYSEGETWKNNLKIFAFDLVGNTVETEQVPIRLNRCGGPGYFEISSPVAQPSTIPEPVLKAGAGQFGLDFTIKWNGPSDKKDVRINRAVLVTQELSNEDIRGRYNLTMNRERPLFNSGSIQYFPDVPDMETNVWYAFIKLNKLETDLTNPSGLDEQFTPELEFPLKIELEYTYKDANGRPKTEKQYKCVPVKIDVDLEASDYLNQAGVNKFLDQTIGFLDNRINDITDIQELTKPLQEYAIYGCAVGLALTYLNNFVFTQIAACGGGDLKKALIDGEVDIEYVNGEPTCKEVPGKTNPTSRVMACCEQTLKSMKFASRVDLICDRIFCPSVPTITKHGKTYSDDIVKSPSATTPQNPTLGEIADYSNLGNAATQCSSKPFSEPSSGGTSKSSCESEFQRAWGAIIPFDAIGGNEYKIAFNYEKNTRTGSKSLGGAQQGFSSVASWITDFTTNICATERPKVERIFDLGESRTDRDTGAVVKKAYRVYPSIEPITGSDTVSQSMNIQYGTLRTSTVTEPTRTGNTPAPSGGDVTVTGKTLSTDQIFTADPGFESLTIDSDGCCSNSACKEHLGGKNYDNAKCYRLPSNVVDYARIGTSKDYAFEPTGGIISSVRAICLPAINGYLQSYKALMTAVKNCFEAVRAGEKLNAGSCQQIMSEVVCDFVIDAISCAWNNIGYLSQRSTGGADAEFTSNFNPFAMIKRAGDSTSNHIATRYGDTSAFRSLFDEGKLMHSLCIGAFTGDWDVEMLNDIFTEAAQPSIKPIAVPTPSQRRFITSNPTSGRPTYTYYVGGMLSAGSGVDSFSFQLVCSNDNSCSRYGTESNPNGMCDCAGHSNEEIVQVPTTVQSLADGEVYDEPPIYYTVEDGEYRYDKLRISFTYKDNEGKSVTDKVDANLAERGTIPPTCRWQLAGLGFRCEARLGDRGLARFLENPRVPTIDGTQKTFVKGEAIAFDSRIEVLNPSSGKEVAKYIRYTIKNHYGNIVYDDYSRLDSGINSGARFPGYTITQENFGSVSTTTPRPNIEKLGGGITTAVTDATSGTSSFVVVFKNGGKSECYAVSREPFKGILDDVVKFKSSAIGTGTSNQITCAGVGIRISGSPNPTSPVITEDVTLSSFRTGISGDALIVTLRTGDSGVSDSCNSVVREWTATAALYHSVSGDDSKYSSNVVYADGRAQEVSAFKFNVVCNSQGTSSASGQTATGVAGDIIRSFTLRSSQIKANEKLVVDFDIYSNNYESLVVKANDKEFPIVVSKENNGKNLMSSAEIGALESNTYTVTLILNGKQSQSRTLTVS